MRKGAMALCHVITKIVRERDMLLAMSWMPVVMDALMSNEASIEPSWFQVSWRVICPPGYSEAGLQWSRSYWTLSLGPPWFRQRVDQTFSSPILPNVSSWKGMGFKEVWLSNETLKYIKCGTSFHIGVKLDTHGRRDRDVSNDKVRIFYLMVSWRQYKMMHNSCFNSFWCPLFGKCYGQQLIGLN